MSDQPIQIVRTLHKHEFAPAYSTDELFRGVCHIVPNLKVITKEEMERDRIEAQRLGGARGRETIKRRFAEKNEILAPSLKEMLGQVFTNIDIAKRLAISVSTVQRYIEMSPELQDLSAKRRTVRAQKSEQNLIVATADAVDGAKNRFENRLPIMQEMMAEGRTNKEIAATFGICERLVTRYISKSPELKASAQKRVEVRKRSTKKFEAIRGKIEVMQTAGMNKTAIAAGLGMGRVSLWKYIKMIEQENKNAQG